MANKKNNNETINQSAVYSVTSYTTKKGGTASLLFGFPSQEEAQKIADKCAKSISATWRYSDTGEKRYCLSMGTRYGEVAQQLCDALNKGDKAAIGKATKASVGVYDAVVEAGKAEREAKKAEREKKNANHNPNANSSDKGYSAAEVAAMLKDVLAGKELPKEVAKLMAA